MKVQSWSYRLIALNLALLIGITSMGISIDLHFCQGKLKSIAVLGTTESCHSSAKQTCSNHPPKIFMTAEEEANCCSNGEVFLQNDEDQQVVKQNLQSIDLNDQLFSAFEDNLQDARFEVYNDADFEHYKPPLIPKDRPVLFEIFLL